MTETLKTAIYIDGKLEGTNVNLATTVKSAFKLNENQSFSFLNHAPSSILYPSFTSPPPVSSSRGGFINDDG